MPPKYSALPEWVVPALHLGGVALGIILLAVVAGIFFRMKDRKAGWIVVAILLLSLPYLAEGLHLLIPRIPGASCLSWAAVGARNVVSGYEITAAILAVWLGTIWYRNNLGNEF